jgi:hypothetical protein
MKSHAEVADALEGFGAAREIAGVVIPNGNDNDNKAKR